MFRRKKLFRGKIKKKSKDDAQNTEQNVLKQNEMPTTISQKETVIEEPKKETVIEEEPKKKIVIEEEPKKKKKLFKKEPKKEQTKVTKSYDIAYVDGQNILKENERILDELVDTDRKQLKIENNYLLYFATTFNDKLESYKRYIKSSYFSSFCMNIISPYDFRNIVNTIVSNETVYLNEIYKYSILKYRFCNYLGFNDLILDKFFDKGFSSYDTLNSDFSTDLNETNMSLYTQSDKQRYQIRENIIIDSSVDLTLKSLLEKVMLLPKDNKIYSTIIQLILTILGQDNDNNKFNKFINASHQKQNIMIGNIRYGLDRHKSLLFKYICDNIGLNCSIVRRNDIQQNLVYEDHCWNIIVIDSKKVVIDFKNYPGKLVLPDNSYTIEYYQLDLI